MSNIYIIAKGAHLNFAMGAIWNRYATGTESFCLYCFAPDRLL